MADVWQSTAKIKPPPGEEVLVDVDDKVRVAVWNGQRGLFFCGERPVFPRIWRDMPRLPKGKKR